MQLFLYYNTLLIINIFRASKTGTPPYGFIIIVISKLIQQKLLKLNREGKPVKKFPERIKQSK